MSNTWPPPQPVVAPAPASPDPLVGGGGFVAEPLPYYRDLTPRVVNVSNPAAGSPWTAKAEGGRIWHVQAVTATLAASANVATRAPILQVTDGTTILYTLPPPFTVAASTTTIFTWLRGAGATFGSQVITAGVAPWPDIPLLGGQTITAADEAIDAADQWSAISLYVYEVAWIPYDPDGAYPPDALTYRRLYPSALLREVN